MRYLSLIAVLLLVGCGPPAPPLTPVEIEEQLQEFGNERLPTEAKKVVDLGNGWKTFELEIDGANHKFIYRGATDFVGDAQYASETVAEISLAPLP